GDGRPPRDRAAQALPARARHDRHALAAARAARHGDRHDRGVRHHGPVRDELAARDHRRRRRGADRHGAGAGRRDRRAGAAQLLQQPGRRYARGHRTLRLAPRAAAGRDPEAGWRGAPPTILRRRAARRARIEIVPMIDVVFFLLVFFMMASLSMAVYAGLPVSLPRAATGQVAPSETAAVTVDRLGHAYLNREPGAMADLDQRVRRLLEGNPALAIVINADGDASHRDVVAGLG